MIRKALSKIKFLTLSNRFLMSSEAEIEQPKKPKSYRMPEQKPIELFQPEFPLKMHNYRTLIYLNKQRLSTPALLQAPFAATFLGLMYLIRYNPWYLTFPASLPIMLGIEILVFFAWLFNKRHYKYIVERVYLQMGSSVEFTFANKIRRKLKGTQDSHQFLTPTELVTPPHAEDGSPAWRQKGFPFPQKLQYKQNPETKQIQLIVPESAPIYGWTKYTWNFIPYIFPKNYEYANWEILIPLLSGRQISFEGATNEIHDFQVATEYATFEEELQWIKQDQQRNKQLKKERLISEEKPIET